MSLGTEYSAVIFSKDLPQSSFLAESSMPLTASRFKNAPKTLFDELMDGNLNDLKIASDQVSENDEAKQSDAESQRSKEHDMDNAGSMDRILKDTEESWKRIVRRLREENTILLRNLKSSHRDLVECRCEKSLLKTKLQEQIDRAQEAAKNSNHNTKKISKVNYEDKAAQTHTSVPAVDTKTKTNTNVLLEKECEQNEKEVEILEERLRLLSTRRKQLSEEIDIMEEQVAAMQIIKSEPAAPSSISYKEEDYRELYLEERRKRLDLMFQKRYLLLVNNSLEAGERKAMNVLSSIGLEPRASTSRQKSLISRARICFYAVVALHRFQNPPKRHTK
ncbi:hypothetical protein VTP01DRAFT_5341 [Rhizomucor pusillus]|uniref:uncharacterized protein n=1 Tax=Rhizomucor pusillus TaxID=4840 RepID=UPI003741F32E